MSGKALAPVVEKVVAVATMAAVATVATAGDKWVMDTNTCGVSFSQAVACALSDKQCNATDVFTDVDKLMPCYMNQ
jgi:hypothetical protein